MAKEQKVKMFPVNDSSLKQLKKIRFKDIKAVVAEMLKNEKLRIEELDFYRIICDDNLISQMKLTPLGVYKYYAVYFFRLNDRYNNSCWGIYQPFSGEFYVIDCEDLHQYYNFNYKNVRFPMGYCKTQVVNSGKLFEVCQSSRLYKITTHWFSDNKTLVACEDSATTKVVYSTLEISPYEDFKSVEIVAWEEKKYIPMYLTN